MQIVVERRWRCGRHAAAFVLLSSAATPALAAQPAPPPADAPPLASAPSAASGLRSFTPADFARFAPRSALDMLNNVPGFSIDEGDTDRRGLGQATGNVLINGERFNSKSVDIFTELGRISAGNVVRIEIVDGATLNISGLTGQVANVVTLSQGLGGNFVWRPQIRTRRTPARLLDGEIAINGALGGTQYTLSFANISRRNGNAGPEIVTDPIGNVLDRRDELLSVDEEQPRLAGTIRRSFANGSVLNANAAFGLYSYDLEEISLRSGPDQVDRDRRVQESEREHNYEFGGEYEFALGGGRLKLIGLHRAEHSPYRQTLIIAFADGRPTEAERFTQTADEAESILRGEYRWRTGVNDWQLSVEGALNRLDIESALFELDGAGDFVPVPFPDAAATVEEKRAEAILTYGRVLASALTLQIALGGEYSNLVQDGAGGLDRTFYRPKGFLNVAWRPSAGWDVSARLERVVGQLDFFDFVASANISGGTQNAGNINLVPPQSWDAKIEATRNLGPWGTATARVYGRLITDVVDIVPIGEDGQAPGNLDGTARVFGLEWTSTFNLDPIGWRGAKVDMNLQFQRTSLVDPLTGRRRPINEEMTREINVNFRHDVPRTDWAWGASFEQYRESAGFRLDQRYREFDTPALLGLFVEHKDVFGLTVRASVDNLLDINESYSRTIFDGRRNPWNSNARFTEDRDRRYGQVFMLTISGTI